MSSPAESAEFNVPSAPEPVRWKSWPLRDDGLRGCGLMALVAAVCAAVAWKVGFAAAVVLGLLQLAAVWRWFAPAEFELNSTGIHCRTLRRVHRIAWGQVAGYRVGRHGVLLLFESDGRPIRANRGVYLPWADRKQQVLTAVRYWLRHDVRGRDLS